MQNIDYSENLFRSIDTIVAERIKNLPYDTTQLVEIIDDTNANAGIYKVTSNHQLEEIAYADNPTYEKGDKVYVLNTADNSRRFILGLYQRSDIGRTDRIMSILNGSLISLKDLLEKQIQDGLDGLDGKIDGLDIYFGLTADGILSLVAAKEEGLATMIRQTADEIRMEAENTYEGLNSSFSITAGQIRSEVHDLTAGLESSITQTAGQIRSEVHDYYNELESSITQTAGQIRSEVHDYKNGLESSITQTAERIETNVADLKNQMETLISQTAYEIRSEAFDIQNGLYSEISQTAEEINFKVEDVNQGLSIVSQTAAEIDSKVIDLEGNFSDISQTATAITQRVTDMEGDFSLLEQTANQISSRVEAVEGNYSEIIQTADEISSRVESIEGNFSEIKQTADEISSRVETVEGNYSQISQTAAEISSRVEDVEGNYSEIVQSVNGITSTVEDLGKDLRTQIEQTDEKISVFVENGLEGYATTEWTSNQIASTVQSIDGKYGQTKLTVDGWKVTTDSGTTEINGAKIKTGTITADHIEAKEFNIAVSSTNWGTSVGSLGYGEGNDGSGTPTKGVMLAGPGGDNYLIATNAGIRMQNGDNTQFYCAGNSIVGDAVNNIYFKSTAGSIFLERGNLIAHVAENSAYFATPSSRSYIRLKFQNKTENGETVNNDVITLSAPTVELGDGGPAITSDRNKKNSISYDMSKYENFYKMIKPAFYKMNNGTSDRYHIGYVYQDTESALLKTGLTSQDFAGLVKMHDTDGELWCGLRYNEFIALNTYMIQKTRKELEEKDNKIQQLENKIDELEQKLNLLLETLS